MKKIKELSGFLLLLLVSCEEKNVTPDQKSSPVIQFQESPNQVSGVTPFYAPPVCKEDFGLCSIDSYDPDHPENVYEVVLERPVETDTGKTMRVGIPNMPNHSSSELTMDQSYQLNSELADALDYENLVMQPGTYQVEEHSTWEGVTTVSITGIDIRDQ